MAKKADLNGQMQLDGVQPLHMDLGSLIGGSGDEVKNAQKIVAPLAQAFPIVAQILGGLSAKNGKEALEPGTITFFVREGKMRFSVNVKSASKTFIGEVGDVENPWESVNFAMMAGNVSSKRYTERAPTSTPPGGEALLY